MWISEYIPITPGCHIDSVEWFFSLIQSENCHLVINASLSWGSRPPGDHCKKQEVFYLLGGGQVPLLIEKCWFIPKCTNPACCSPPSRPPEGKDVPGCVSTAGGTRQPTLPPHLLSARLLAEWSKSPPMLTFEEPRGRAERSDFRRSDLHSLPHAVQLLWPKSSIPHRAVLEHHAPVTSWSVSVCGLGGGGHCGASCSEMPSAPVPLQILTCGGQN